MDSIDALWQILISTAQDLQQLVINGWGPHQAAGLIVLFLIAHVMAGRIEPRVEGWLRAREGLTASQLRLAILILRRTRGLLFILMAWIVYAVMREVTWPSRSYLIGSVATLVTAWLFVGVATRLIRNGIVRALVRWGALIIVTLSILGIREDAEILLEDIALSVGEIRLSLLMVLRAVVTLAVLVAAAAWLAGVAERRLESNRDMSPSLRVLTAKLLRIGLLVVAVITALQVIGFDLTSLTILSGAIGLGLGFGLQKVVSNLISGVIVLLDKSIKPGDVISIDDTFGWVSELNARYVAVITRDGREYLIPNEDLITTQVVNWSHSSDLVRLDIHFGVAYDSDPHEVRKLARDAAGSVDRVVGSPSPVCHIVGFGDSSIDLILRFWIRDPQGGLTNVRGNVFLALWDALKAAGVEIPFPRRDVEIRNAGVHIAPMADSSAAEPT